MAFQSTDGPDEKAAVNMVIISHLVEDFVRPRSGKGSDRSDLFKITRSRLDRLYSGQTSPQGILIECDSEDLSNETEHPR